MAGLLRKDEKDNVSSRLRRCSGNMDEKGRCIDE